MLVKETFLGMQLERRAGSENLHANLSVPPRRKSSWKRDTLCYHTHTHSPSYSPSQTTSLSPSGERAKEEVQRESGEAGEKGEAD